MLIMHCCQPLVLIFQFFKIFEQITLTPLSLNPDFVLDKLLLIFGRKMVLLSHMSLPLSHNFVSFDSEQQIATKYFVASQPPKFPSKRLFFFVIDLLLRQVKTYKPYCSWYGTIPLTCFSMLAIYFLISFPLITIFFFLDQSNIPIIFINKEMKLQYLNIELRDFDFHEWYTIMFEYFTHDLA